MTNLPALTAEEVAHHLTTVPEWQADPNATAIARTWEWNGFKEAIVFVNMVAKLAEEEQHHPDIIIHGYNKVTLTLSTHSAGGLTEKDFEVARKIEGLFEAN